MSSSSHLSLSSADASLFSPGPGLIVGTTNPWPDSSDAARSWPVYVDSVDASLVQRFTLSKGRKERARASMTPVWACGTFDVDQRDVSASRRRRLAPTALVARTRRRSPRCQYRTS
jgi:hypothetical protein